MAAIDKILGLILFAFAIPALFLVDHHWVVSGLVALAAATFVFCIPKPFKKRCITCGHFFYLTVWQKYFAKKGKRRCIDCACSDKSVSTANKIPAQ
ncbi:MAG: hypothetical protein JJ850_09335 [Kordiimonadaceae bacterium]|nr:hypothetical protein [Kordiimonadaceae bacterium]MBO6569334.1 hypothetical protein [Kordiimonadaceae bacterium]MBO6964809.1 hypothetical protein [Kordiimonadaceae bacterium]